MSNRSSLSLIDDESHEQAEHFIEPDAASQITLLNAPEPHPGYDQTAVTIWDNRYTSLAGFAAYVQYCVDRGWRECLQFSAWFWRQSWTAELSSFVFAILALVGLIVTLSAYDERPIPEWPHSITINSVVSLFALCMRIGVGVVLAEGTLLPDRKSLVLNVLRYKSNKVALVCQTTDLTRYGTLRSRKS